MSRNKLDIFMEEGGKDVYFEEVDANGKLVKRLRKDVIYAVTNLEKKEHKRHTATVNGDIIDRFVNNGFYKIERLGTIEEIVPDMATTDAEQRRKERRKVAQQEILAIKKGEVVSTSRSKKGAKQSEEKGEQ